MLSERPNILFLMTDQHRFDVAGFAGDPVVHTPMLDELARSGTVFTNAYAGSPVCVPGRQCMMAGKLPGTLGLYDYGTDLPPGSMTFARALSEYAYNTVCCGKLHHSGTDQMQGWNRRPAGDIAIHAHHIPGLIPEEYDRYRAELGCGKWTNQKEVERAGIGYGPYQMDDDLAVQAALNTIAHTFCAPMYDRPQSHLPMLLKVSLNQPHYPFLTDEKKFNYYINRVPIYREDPCDHAVLSVTQNGPQVMSLPRDIRRATAAYYGRVETADAHFQEVVDALLDAGQDLDDWIIIYTSDHGDMLGQHGIWEKTQFYEGSVHVPLIVRWPKRFGDGGVVEQNVSLCDLFATLCELAGIPIPEGLDSRSLVPLLEGRTDDWSDEVVSQYKHRKVYTMIKQGSLKYMNFADRGTEVLFDLADDPREEKDLSGRPEYAAVLSRFRKRLGEQLAPEPA